jgi:hypothetical protein
MNNKNLKLINNQIDSSIRVVGGLGCVSKMKALLALRSVGFCVGQRQMCLNVRWGSIFLFFFMQQKFICYSVVWFGLLQ